ncbi:MAG: hypothetical protein GDA68_02900 [Nitrospira sp. CR2.1]|nr:hypothetical protein [Nitrospira sp. CR2.1]
MVNQHLIAKQVFELRVGFNEGATSQFQNFFSGQYWQSIVPAFERLFDRLIAPDEIVRVDRLEIDVGRWSAEEILSGRFVESLVSRLESTLLSTVRGGASEAQVQPIHVGRFDLWLYFLEHGCLPAGVASPDSQEEWNRQVFECLATESSARQRLRKLVARRPVAMERLLLQYDETFLQQILALLTSRNQDDVRRLVSDIAAVVVRPITDLSDRIRSVGKSTPTEVASLADALLRLVAHLLGLKPGGPRESEVKSRMVQALGGAVASPSSLAQWLMKADFWKIVLRDFERPEVADVVSAHIAEVFEESADLRRLAAESVPGRPVLTRDLRRRIELAVWRMLIDEVVVKGSHSDTPAFPAGPAEEPSISRAEDGSLFYVQAAGVILLHPFLVRFFRQLDLCEEDAFRNEACRQRAVCLVHHLATGEVRAPEYQLVLPKLLCGMPLNVPLDHGIEIEAAEQFESESLLRAAIAHWEALGKCSPDWLRQGFFQRAGKLEKRETGWHLLVERKAQDILLDRLPQGWGLGMVKLPWMDRLLRVDWRSF